MAAAPTRSTASSSAANSDRFRIAKEWPAWRQRTPDLPSFPPSQAGKSRGFQPCRGTFSFAEPLWSRLRRHSRLFSRVLNCGRLDADEPPSGRMGQTAATHNRRGIKETDRMKAFGYVSAKDVAHAVALLTEHGTKAKILAGGTDLLVELKHAVHNPEILVDISRLRELKNIAVADDGLHIGALATHADIMSSPIILSMFPALVAAAHSIGAMQTRNLGTLGGNLVTCVPSVDSGPVLIALEASVIVAGAAGQRRMPLADLFVGPRKTSLKPGELLMDIVIPKENLGKPPAFEKFGLRKARRWRWSMSGRAFG